MSALAGAAKEVGRLTDPALYGAGDPHELWRAMRAADQVHWEPPGEWPGFWALTRYDDVLAVLADREAFSSANGILLRPLCDGPDPGGGRTLALTDRPRHARLRALVNRWFSPRGVAALQQEMRAVAGAAIDAALAEGGCEFVFDVAAQLPLHVICRLLGVPDEDWDDVFALSTQAFAAADPVARSRAHQQILLYFLELADERRDEPEDDLVSVLATGSVEGEPLSQEDVLLNCDNLLVGGTENVRLASAGGLLAFMQHPEAWAALRADRSLLRGAVEEVLRWTSPATHLVRTVTREVELAGQELPAGAVVTVWPPSANRDERCFADPDRFDVRRAPNRHLALGMGEHFCLGAGLARLEMRVLFDELLDRVGLIEPAGEPVRVHSIVVNGLERLPVRFSA